MLLRGTNSMACAGAVKMKGSCVPETIKCKLLLP